MQALVLVASQGPYPRGIDAPRGLPQPCQSALKNEWLGGAGDSSPLSEPCSLVALGLAVHGPISRFAGLQQTQAQSPWAPLLGSCSSPYAVSPFARPADPLGWPNAAGTPPGWSTRPDAGNGSGSWVPWVAPFPSPP